MGLKSFVHGQALFCFLFLDKVVGHHQQTCLHQTGFKFLIPWAHLVSSFHSDCASDVEHEGIEGIKFSLDTQGFRFMKPLRLINKAWFWKSIPVLSKLPKTENWLALRSTEKLFLRCQSTLHLPRLIWRHQTPKRDTRWNDNNDVQNSAWFPSSRKNPVLRVLSESQIMENECRYDVYEGIRSLAHWLLSVKRWEDHLGEMPILSPISRAEMRAFFFWVVSLWSLRSPRGKPYLSFIYWQFLEVYFKPHHAYIGLLRKLTWFLSCHHSGIVHMCFIVILSIGFCDVRCTLRSVGINTRNVALYNQYFVGMYLLPLRTTMRFRLFSLTVIWAESTGAVVIPSGYLGVGHGAGGGKMIHNRSGDGVYHNFYFFPCCFLLR